MLFFAATTTNDDASLALFLAIVVIFIFVGIPLLCYFDGEKQKKTKREEYRKRREEAYNARQAHIRDWRRVRAEFDELRLTPEFKIWREEQYRCQEKKCAWCRKPIQCYSQYTHVDHIKPLYHGGTNDYWNLVLSCSYCNRRKGDWRTGWTGEPFEVARHHANRKPDWVKPNKYAYGVKTFRDRDDEDDSSPKHATAHPYTIPAALGQDSVGKEIGMSSKSVEASCTQQPKPDMVANNTGASSGHHDPSLQQAPVKKRQLSEKEQLYLSEINQMLADMRTNNTRAKIYRNNEKSEQFSSGYEGEGFDPDDPEYIADQYMSFDYDDWADKYGPEW